MALCHVMIIAVLSYMKYFILIVLFFVSGCKSIQHIESVQEVEKLVKQVKHRPHDVHAIHQQVIKTEQTITTQLQSIDALFATLKKVITKEWGEGNQQYPSNKKYVKYSNDYQARAVVDFDAATVVVETIAQRNIQSLLTQAITTTLLTPDDPSKVDIFSSQSPTLTGEPFLYQQVLDTDKKPIRYTWRANRFATYLVSNTMSRHTVDGRVIHSVTFPLVDNNLHLRKEKFSTFVLASAKQYKIPASLIYGIIETESSFNPYAVSSANAFGLMQVVPATAGKDVYQKMKHKSGEPSRATLFDPKQNIDIGSAYLSLLKNSYLKSVKNSQSQRFAMICAYNGGAGNVLRTFDKHRTTAFNQINALTPSRLYQILRTKHPKAESRRYLEKVVKAERNYQ